MELAGYAQVWPDTLWVAGYARAYSAMLEMKWESVCGGRIRSPWSWIRSIGAGYAQIEAGYAQCERIRPSLKRWPDTLRSVFFFQRFIFR